LDELDIKIILLLVSGSNNKEISQSIKIPLSTVQRRTRRIFEKGIVRNRVEPNYNVLGLSKGLLHVYVNGKDAREVATGLARLEGIVEVSLHIGNSDVVGQIIYKDSNDILQAISEAKKIDGVERVVWSEEVMSVPIDQSKANMSYFVPKTPLR
jgi:DNA-binding Lrp family transcriptional regulator